MSHKPDPKCEPRDLDSLLAFIRARPDVFGKLPSRKMVEKAVDARLTVYPRLLDAQPWEVVGGEYDLGGES